MIIALVNQKGGCAKSTTAVHLAYWLRKQGSTVRLVDSDAQRSSSKWAAALDQPIDAIALDSPDDALEKLPQLAADVDYLIIDGPAGLSEVTRAALFRTDFALVPTQPTGLDLASASDAIRLIAQAQSVRNGPPGAGVFLSRATKGTRLLTEARSLLERSKVPVFDAVVHQRQTIADCFGQRSVLWEMNGRASKESAYEFEKLFNEVMEAIEHGT